MTHAIPDLWTNCLFESDLCNESDEPIHKNNTNESFTNQTDLVLEFNSVSGLNDPFAAVNSLLEKLIISE